MIQGKWFSPGSDISPVLYVRKSVFGRSADSLDPISWNVLVFQDSEPAASGRIWWQNGAFWLGDICVLKMFRGQHLGDLVLRLLLFKAQAHAAHEVRLRCPRRLAGFFSRLGMKEQPTEESAWIEMMISGKNISLDSCSNCPKKRCPNRQP